jgi:hypothetical protein
MTKRKAIQAEEMSPSRRASELAEAHWKYVNSVLLLHGVTEREADIIGYHYRSAMIHGFKHGFDYALSIPPGSTPTI